MLAASTRTNVKVGISDLAGYLVVFLSQSVLAGEHGLTLCATQCKVTSSESQTPRYHQNASRPARWILSLDLVVPSAYTRPVSPRQWIAVKYFNHKNLPLETQVFVDDRLTVLPALHKLLFLGDGDGVRLFLVVDDRLMKYVVTLGSAVQPC